MTISTSDDFSSFMMSVDGASPGSLEAEALKRRERLRALKKRPASSELESTKEELSGVLPKPKFRSYNPQDDSLKENTIERVLPETVEEKVEDEIEKARKSETIIEEVDLMNLAPRKPDWDLKRDMSKKLEKLERRTQRAIVEIIRERIKSGKEDIVIGVSTASAKDVDSD